ncbi:hypothetical protein SEA_WEASELS2_21 [Rhodococcus phage Weasels2]|uniref:Uncharacterized protein n=1 Tax=Rhodococcus phage Weasels2 TaxID=1897437 RepID=A0A1I9SA05_9CAUD|nr:hypothetical protein FDH04_gp021 [Rhodococcus phage Weasels2]AOZ63611.1 hypothetical protein SEA_WEASELS2_21 [Rhodococcus phage Weasels2]
MDPKNYEEGLEKARLNYMKTTLFTKDSICRKCHFKYITVRYDRDSFGYYVSEFSRAMCPEMPRPTPINFDVIRRTCPQCGFSWNERPLDSESNNNND